MYYNIKSRKARFACLSAAPDLVDNNLYSFYQIILCLPAYNVMQKNIAVAM